MEEEEEEKKSYEFKFDDEKPHGEIGAFYFLDWRKGHANVI